MSEKFGAFATILEINTKVQNAELMEERPEPLAKLQAAASVQANTLESICELKTHELSSMKALSSKVAHLKSLLIAASAAGQPPLPLLDRTLPHHALGPAPYHHADWPPATHPLHEHHFLSQSQPREPHQRPIHHHALTPVATHLQRCVATGVRAW